MKNKSILKLASIFLLVGFIASSDGSPLHRNARFSKMIHELPDEKIIDVSTDLTSLGIAQQNMVPNNKTIDAGPLLEAAVAYAGKHNYTKVSIPLGNYYFLTQRNNAHVFIANVNNVEINGHGATFNFSSRKVNGVIIRNCNNFGLINTSLDYSLDLPFTSATVASVDVANGMITTGNVLGRPLGDFVNSSKYSVRIFVLRKDEAGNVKSVPVEWLFPEDGPLSNNIKLKGNAADIAKNLQKIQKGDILCISERSYGGANALSFVSYPPQINNGNYAKDVVVYSSPAIGVATMWQTNLTFSNVRVEPKQGRNQYVSSNADGINLVNSGLGNSVSNCVVMYTGDDGISFSGNLYALVTAVNSDNTLSVNERYMLKANQKIVFADAVDLHELGSATVQQEPVRQKGGPSVITLSNSVSGVKAGTLIYLPEGERSPNILIQGNTIGYTYSRGIYFAGVNGARIIGNKIEHTQSCGILMQAERNIPPVTNATIEDNIIDGAFERGDTNQPGAIESSVESVNTNAFLNKGLKINNNKITIGGNNPKHVGVFIANTRGYSISGNSISLKRQDGTIVDMPSDHKLIKSATSAEN